jgi:uncharacterized membrane protein
MKHHLTVLLRSVTYALRGGFLVRPLAVAVLLGTAGAVLSTAEEALPGMGSAIPEVLFPSRQDPQAAQAILSAIATSIMTVVSIVFAMLLMTLTLASTQFSPRILVSFVRDRSTQSTLGVFLGTFAYCMAVLPAARSLPSAFVPVVSVTGAMLLALICVGWLIFFIHHISQSISVNHIVDRIARETELVIEEYMPRKRGLLDLPEFAPSYTLDDEIPILSRQSGYIRFIDIDYLVALGRELGVRIGVERRVGHFVPAGVPLMRVSRGSRITAERESQLLEGCDLGPVRTMQQDVEFGVIQIADIALRAISPAVNDPSTAISCVDQLSRIVIRWLERVPPPTYYYNPPHVLRLVLPWIRFEGLLDTAFEQIRHYSQSDAAVSLRLLRAYDDIAKTVTDAEQRSLILRKAKRVVASFSARAAEDDLARLQRRLATIEVEDSAVDELPPVS